MNGISVPLSTMTFFSSEVSSRYLFCSFDIKHRLKDVGVPCKKVIGLSLSSAKKQLRLWIFALRIFGEGVSAVASVFELPHIL